MVFEQRLILLFAVLIKREKSFFFFVICQSDCDCFCDLVLLFIFEQNCLDLGGDFNSFLKELRSSEMIFERKYV